MSEKDQDADHPLVSKITERDQNRWKPVVECILIEITLSSDKYMIEEPSKMLTELNYIEKLHFLGSKG